MRHATASPELTECIQTCFHCYQTCQQTALLHCLELGGEHVEPVHFRLMIDCAEAARSAAALMINGSRFHGFSCRLCAEACRACAKSCRKLGDMEDCAEACDRCAESCDAMAERMAVESQASPA